MANEPFSPERLKEAMNGMSNVDLANKLGCSRSNISMYLTGARTPNKMTVQLMSICLGVSPAWLMGFDVNKYLDIDRISSEAQKIAKAYDKATPKDKSTVRLVLSEYLDDEVVELANVARTGANITVTETLGEHEARRAATLHDIETLEDTKLP